MVFFFCCCGCCFLALYKHSCRCLCCCVSNEQNCGPCALVKEPSAITVNFPKVDDKRRPLSFPKGALSFFGKLQRNACTGFHLSSHTHTNFVISTELRSSCNNDLIHHCRPGTSITGDNCFNDTTISLSSTNFLRLVVVTRLFPRFYNSHFRRYITQLYLLLGPIFNPNPSGNRGSYDLCPAFSDN